VLDKRVKDVMPESSGGWCLSGCCSIVVFILVILFFPATVKQLGQHKVGLTKNTISGVIDLDNTYEPGRYWLGFWRSFVEFPSTIQTIQFSSESSEEGVQQLGPMEARDSKGEPIIMDITVQYKLKGDLVGQIYKEFTTLYEDVYISELRQALSKVFGDFEVKESWVNYPATNEKLHQACIDILNLRHAECWGLQLWGIKASNVYEAAIVQTQVQKQMQNTEEEKKVHSIYRSETQTLMGEYDVEMNKIRIDGTAQVIKIEGDSTALAEKKLVQAQAEMLMKVKETVVLPLPDGGNQSMNAGQLMQYQKHIMLQAQSGAHYLYNFKSASELQYLQGASR
jgi:hypothetical protein